MLEVHNFALVRPWVISSHQQGQLFTPAALLVGKLVPPSAIGSGGDSAATSRRPRPPPNATSGLASSLVVHDAEAGDGAIFAVSEGLTAAGFDSGSVTLASVSEERDRSISMQSRRPGVKSRRWEAMLFRDRLTPREANSWQKSDPAPSTPHSP